LLPFSINPADATSSAERAIRADAFDVGADPESGHVVSSEGTRLCNASGYIPRSWSEARTQIRSVYGLLGALLGDARPVLLAYGRFVRLYDRM
jgi:hypothetical protein